MGEEPLVSVILPTYNRAATLNRAAMSVLAQSYRALELIVVDDGSTDETELVVRAIDDPRVRYIRRDTCGGASVARNEGIQAALGSLIAFQDSDDEWLPYKLERQVSVLMDSGPDVALVYCGLLRWIHGSSSIARVAVPHRDAETHSWDEALLFRNYIWTQTWLVRKASLQDTGEFDPRIKRVQDWDLVLRLLRKYQATFLNTPLVLAFDTPGSLINDDTELGGDLSLVLSGNAELYGKFPKIRAAHIRNIARREFLYGQSYNGWRRMFQALKVWPWSYKWYLEFLAACMGPKMLSRAARASGDAAARRARRS